MAIENCTAVADLESAFAFDLYRIVAVLAGASAIVQAEVDEDRADGNRELVDVGIILDVVRDKLHALAATVDDGLKPLRRKADDLIIGMNAAPDPVKQLRPVA